MTVFEKAAAWIKNMFDWLVREIHEDILPAAVWFVNAFKTVAQNPATGIAVDFFHHGLTPELITKIKKSLPSIFLSLGLAQENINDIKTMKELNEAIQKVAAQVNWDNDHDKEKFLSSLGAEIMTAATDKKLSHPSAVAQLYYFFHNYDVKDLGKPNLEPEKK